METKVVGNCSNSAKSRVSLSDGLPRQVVADGDTIVDGDDGTSVPDRPNGNEALVLDW